VVEVALVQRAKQRSARRAQAAIVYQYAKRAF